MPYASTLIPRLYMALPIAALLWAMVRTRRSGNPQPMAAIFSVLLAGAICGLLVALVYMRLLRGTMPVSQAAIACYWGMSVACVLAGTGAVLNRVVGRGAKHPVAETLSSLFRAGVLLAVIIPYVSSMALLYRPRMQHAGTPESILSVDYQDVRFAATDGLHLRGWWIPAAAPSDSDADSDTGGQGEQTVILCHGFGGDKTSDLRLARDLIPNGYNVLAFDFRAHGDSEGQLTTFGDLERRDVLGAVRWIRKNHPEQCRKIFGVGEGLGAAALIGAAGDPTDGQQIDAIAVFAPYDSLPSLINAKADEFFASQAGWLASNVALPVAGFQLGARLTQFSPEREVEKLAPRPILVIGAENDRTIPVSLSQELYDQASQPKYGYWIPKSGHRAMISTNKNASLALRIFFATARKIL